jgi:protein-disulfide isomerase
MHDMLFANQASLSVASLKQYAATLGLDTADFNSCLDSGEKSAEAAKETQQAVDAGGRGTPYFVVINHKSGKTSPVSGAVPWANFQAAIESVK